MQTFHTSDKSVSHIGSQSREIKETQREMVFDVLDFHFEPHDSLEPLEREVSSFERMDSLMLEAEAKVESRERERCGLP
jgi:hypothetical protein